MYNQANVGDMGKWWPSPQVHEMNRARSPGLLGQWEFICKDCSVKVSLVEIDILQGSHGRLPKLWPRVVLQPNWELDHELCVGSTGYVGVQILKPTPHEAALGVVVRGRIKWAWRHPSDQVYYVSVAEGHQLIPGSYTSQFKDAGIFMVAAKDFRPKKLPKKRPAFLMLQGSYVVQAKEVPLPNHGGYLVQGAGSVPVSYEMVAQDGFTQYITNAVYQRFAGDNYCTIQAFTTAAGMGLGNGPGKLGVSLSDLSPHMSIQSLDLLMKKAHGKPLHAFRLMEEKHNAFLWANIWKGPPRILLCECNVHDMDGKLHCIAVDTARNMLWVAPSNRPRHIPGECEGAVKVQKSDIVERSEAGWKAYMLQEFSLEPPNSVWCVMVRSKRILQMQTHHTHPSILQPATGQQHQPHPIQHMGMVAKGVATNQGELLVNRTSIDFAVQQNVPNITGVSLGETLLGDSVSTHPLTLAVDTEADRFDLRFLLREIRVNKRKRERENSKRPPHPPHSTYRD
jgi:hypothetical protein